VNSRNSNQPPKYIWLSVPIWDSKKFLHSNRRNSCSPPASYHGNLHDEKGVELLEYKKGNSYRTFTSIKGYLAASDAPL